MPQLMQKRVNFVISYSQFKAVKQIVTHTKTSLSDFFRKALAERIDRINRQRLEKELEEGYKMLAEENIKFAKLSAEDIGAEVLPPWE